MTQEITVVGGIAFANGERVAEMPIERLLIDQTGTDFSKTAQTIGFAAEEAIAKGEIGADDGGLMLVKNLDTANFVTIHGTGEGPLGNDSGGIKIPATEFAIFRFNKTPYATADTGNVEIYYLLLEN